ncbi:TetR/AcrR family transcriptional regulator C-terminal domain-containing protein [Streptomyces sp. NPDC004610]|uniref:TetR/AcrR family transcriptional regulator C-terminal domain-containing protein n=1 Tax=unclassified Streptomyces TaxID=2593676 RepID=UPI0033B58F2F
MTNRQYGDRLDPATVIRAGLAILDERGLDAVSTRAVAHRLGVRVSTVQWHVKSKARMLELMADAVLGEIPLLDLPPDPGPRVREIAVRCRRVLLSHRDGAALVVGTNPIEPGTLGFADGLSGALLDCGLGDREAAWASWTLIYFTLGLVQEEQAVGQRALGELLAGAISPQGHPALHRVAGRLAPVAFAERFAYGVDAILAGVGVG